MRGRITVLVLAAAALVSACARHPRYNLLVVTFDTTRADFLGCYGKTSARTPNLDRLAAEGTLFENCLTAVPITLPSHTTMFTGTYPLLHGVRDNGRFKVPPQRTTLAEVLKSHGYATGAAIGAFPLTRNWGINQGFDFYDDHITIGMEDERGHRVPARGMFFDERPAPRVNEAILPWLRDHASQRFFAWIHYWDPHQPHVAPAPFSELYAHDPYQAEIAYADQALGVVLDELRRRGVYDRTIVAMLGDHGEGRGEHDEDTHSMLLYQATLHVPMILRIPGAPAGRRVRARVGTVDLVPTLLELLDLPVPPEVQGRSLVGEMQRLDPAPKDHRAYYAETLSPRLSYGWGELRALFEGRSKYIYGPREELFDLTADPHELQNLVPGAEAERMHHGFEAFLAQSASKASAEAVTDVDRESRDRLAALGYIAGDSDGPARVEEVLRRDGDAPQARVASVSLWSRCKSALQRKDFLSAREQALRLVSREPENAFYRALLATAQLGLGQTDAAATLAEHGPISAQNDYVYVEVARMLFSTGARPRAAALARRIVDTHPSAQAHYLLGEMYAELRDRAAQERELRAALQLDPHHARARQSLAVRLAENGQGAEAEAEFRRLLDDAPLEPAAHLNYATLLLKAERFDDALEHLKRALDLAPDYWKAHLALLALYVQTGDREQAQATLSLLEQRCRDTQLVAEARRLAEGS